MILISVLYQNAYTSRILEPSPQGLISSTDYQSRWICLRIFAHMTYHSITMEDGGVDMTVIAIVN